MSAADLLADRLNEMWGELEQSDPPGPGALTVMEIPVSTPAGPLLLGSGGGRHLLVPLSPGAHRSFQEDRRGAAVHLLLRPPTGEGSGVWHADLVGPQESLYHVFAPFCADVIAHIDQGPHDPIKQLRSLLASWRSLFASGERRLSTRELAALFAELAILTRLLRFDRQAARVWRGPLRGLHDFSDDHTALEVKATLTGDERKVVIHQLDQLQPPTGGTLALILFVLEVVSDEGASVPDAVAQARELADTTDLAMRLGRGGYHEAHAAGYAQTKFVTRDEIWYAVDGDFPRLQGDSFAGGAAPEWVSDVQYRLDLGAGADYAMDGEAAATRLEQLAGNG